MTESAESPTRRWVRSDGDIARLIFALGITAAAFGLATLDPASARSFSADLVALINRLPPTASRFLIGVIQLGAMVAPIVLIVAAYRSKFTQAAIAAVSAACAAGLAALGAGPVRDSVPRIIEDTAHRSSWVTGAAFPSGIFLAAVAAAAVVLGRRLDSKWRRIIIWSLVLVVVARALTGVESIFVLVAALSLGVAVGSALLVAVGIPPHVPSDDDIATSLRAAGLAVDNVHGVRTTSGGPTYRAVLANQSVFVKVADADTRDVDALARLVRWFRVKGVEDERPFGQQHLIEHEAVNLAIAANADVRMPPVRAVGTLESTGDAFLAIDWIDGVSLNTLAPDEISDNLLEQAFGQLQNLHLVRIAHRLANVEHILVTPNGETTIIDLGWAERGAPDRLLAQDIAECVVSVAAIVGPERAIASAYRVFGQQLADTLPLIQPLALTAATRKAAKSKDSLLSAVREHISSATGAEEYQLEPMRRLGIKSILTFVATLVIGNLLLGLAANADEIWTAMRGADLARVPIAVFLVAFSFLAGSISLLGAVTNRLGFWRTSAVMVAQSFLNRFTPANAGGMALRIRYLQRSGVDPVVATGSVALTSLASGVMQVVFTVVLFTWAGTAESGGYGFKLPSSSIVLVVIVVLLGVAGLAFFTAFGRKLVDRMRESVAKMWAELSALARQPSKLALLFGGAFLCKLVPIVILYESMAAFGLEVHFAQLGAMYIAATTVASAAPTPGGVGAIEAALTAGLSGLGVDPATAVAVVLYFRFMTYWLPILPSWLFFQYVQKADYV